MILEILLNLCLDINHKQGGFSEIFLKKSLEFFPSKGDDTIVFNLSLVLLPAKIDPLAEKQGCEGNMFEACDTGHVEIILILLIKIVVFHI